MSTFVLGAQPHEATTSETVQQQKLQIATSISTWASSPYEACHVAKQEAKSKVSAFLPRLVQELGSDSEAQQLIQKVNHWLDDMFLDAMHCSRQWLRPHLSISEEAEIVFEWEHKNKSLTIYISRDEITFIQAWGVSIETEMRDGQATLPSTRKKLWSWLVR